MAIDWQTLPSLTALRAFAATAELRGFSQASRALKVTHAAVARQVRALEDHFGRSLVQREGRGVSLMVEDEQLAAALAEGFAVVQRGVEALRSGEADQRVRLTRTASFAAQWLMPRLCDFWERYPEIGLSLHPDSKLFDPNRERMDLGIRYGNRDWPGLEASYLALARLVVAASPSLLDPTRALTLAEMQGMEWILAR